MDPTNKHFYATVMAPKLIQYRVSQLDEATNEYELLAVLSEIEMFARTAQSLLSEALDGGVKVEGSLSTHRNGNKETQRLDLDFPPIEDQEDSRSQTYKCSYCGFSTDNSSSLGGHMSQNHKEHRSENTGKSRKRRKKASPTKTTAPEGFPRNLREAREEVGLNQTELAERVGMHPVTISKYESGERSPKYRNLKRLADALGVSPEELK